MSRNLTPSTIGPSGVSIAAYKSRYEQITVSEMDRPSRSGSPDCFADLEVQIRDGKVGHFENSVNERADFYAARHRRQR